MSKLQALAIAAGLALTAATAQAAPADCPNGGTVRFGVEPFEAASRMIPIFDKIGQALGEKLGCKVQVLITSSYTAEIEAMRAKKLEFGEFGPFSYVLAHQVADAQAVAAYAGADGKPDTYTAGIVTWPGSGITTLKDVAGKTFAYSDPASTSGHLFPSYGLKLAGIDPDKGIHPFYAGSHTASFEALRNHKVQAGELNSTQITVAEQAGAYKPGDFVELWRSAPIPDDPIAVRGDLPAPLKARLTAAVQSLDFSKLLTPEEMKSIAAPSGHTVPQTDAAFDVIRKVVSFMNIDLAKMNE
jgi:phosphonate transport system substrate-binding protein